ncbi:unnamed protein product (mitochondrion) [Plasmodiophora brassicae]|uniref:Trichohyalin-plectin-homology domain-containing protein n=1 Tax=Plasmodiophora brassicae TaxID=37360 RepID=A0A3P3YFS5_PLABS|nr:unnamed protein product [Plasmodiophora brassicae]
MGDSRSVLSSIELRRLQKLAFGSEQQSATSSNENKNARLKALSNGHVRKWEQQTNASSAARQEKELREERQRRIDEEYEARLAAERKAMIDRAEREVYDNTDEVKSLLAGMMISDVYRERAHQKQVRERRAALEKFRDERIQAELDRQNAEAIAAERAAIDERRRIDQQIAQTQIEQFAEYKRARRARLRATVEEGLRLAKQAKEAHKEEIRKNAERKQSIKEQKLAALGDNFRLRAIRDEERRKAEDELAKIKAYAEEKERKEQQRKKIAEDRFRHRLLIKQRLIDAQTEAMNKRMNNEDEILAAHIQEADRKQEERVRSDKEKQRQQKEMIDKCRQVQIAEMEARRAEERRMAQEMKSKWDREKREFDEEQEAGRCRQRNEAEALAEYHRRQMMAKWQREQGQRDDLNQWVRTQMQEHEAFVGELKQVTQKMMGDYADEGRDTLPIAIALSKNASLRPPRPRHVEMEDEIKQLE